ncbi:thioesterase [Frondihabitans sucicola]|uniref:Thioesterase n=1 Tax=Frondihabitans sucicola TaxID=1268041 RepID=A0ABN6Y2M6_9MICO|nr:thioesterase family protein [Frondihabitans sucicola]BDZ50342.1 thioesterase [Frondihabitans sucicola]
MSYRRVVPTRWNDNDMYGHLNNTVYYAAMDTVINTWMIEEAGLRPLVDDVLGYCVASSCSFSASASFPEEIAVELGVGRLGRTSVTWRPRIVRASDDAELATGEFVTVFVDGESHRPVPIPAGTRLALETAFAVPQP